jgi:hypothetical protein
MSKEKELAESVMAGTGYVMTKDVLVKPLEVIKVMKQFQEPIVDKKSKDDGMEVKDFTKTRTVNREVDSNFRTGIVLAMPINNETCQVGDTIVFPKKFAIEFDLFKDSLLIKPYDVVAVIDEVKKDLAIKEIYSSIKEPRDITDNVDKFLKVK